MPEQTSWQANLSPPSRVTAAKAQSFASFVAEQESKALLLVSLKNESDKFITTLSQLDAEPREHLVSDMIEGKTGMGEPLRDTWPSELLQSFDEDDLVGLVAKTRHFVLAIRKRPGFELREPDRVVVGRARASDVVLSSATVSKLHAWFEMDENGSYFVIDKRSRNGTRVNGQRIPAERAVPLSPGDRLEFGLVRAVFCPTVTFWKAVNHK
jgi:hypothetical protein